MPLTMDFAVTFSSGYKMSLPGSVVFQNSNVEPATFKAFNAGYRYAYEYLAF